MNTLVIDIPADEICFRKLRGDNVFIVNSLTKCQVAEKISSFVFDGIVDMQDDSIFRTWN